MANNDNINKSDPNNKPADNTGKSDPNNKPADNTGKSDPESKPIDDTGKKTPDNKPDKSDLPNDDNDFVVIGCRFPNGLIIEVGRETVTLKGSHDRNVPIGFTKVRRSFWEAWEKINKTSELLTSISVFKSQNDVR